MSNEERVDIVDESGTVIGETSKAEAHAQGLLHKTVIGQVLNTAGEWLLVRQSSTRQDVGQYVCPVGGHVSAGERDDDALVRETQEELGFSPSDFTYSELKRFVYNRTVLGRIENHLFIVYMIHSDATPRIGDEAESVRFFSDEELRAALRDTPQLFGAPYRMVVKNCFPQLLV